MAKTRRTFDDDFKRNAMRMVAEGRSIRSVAAELGITEQHLHKWRKQLQERHLEGVRTPKEYESEIRELRKRAERAEMERDILKKAVSIFSHPSAQK
jgi:transposase